MLVNVDDDFYKKISEVSEVLGITPGEHLEREYDSNVCLKSVLLTEKNQFIKFVEDYKHILDQLFFLSEDSFQSMGESLREVDNSPEMKRVFSRLNTLVGEDVGFITKLYMTYKEEEGLQY